MYGHGLYCNSYVCCLHDQCAVLSPLSYYHIAGNVSKHQIWRNSYQLVNESLEDYREISNFGG